MITKFDKKSYELIVDNFAGGGGASTGIELATGRPVDIAINHDPYAILMHSTNHPYTRHFCESVWDVNPAEICAGRSVGLMWLSPDCKHFSRAKGGKPVDKNVRGLAWIALRWAATVRPRVIILENVPEFVTWGRLGKDGKPDKKHTGETFRSFVYQLRQKGYDVDWRELKACDYGAPTIRKRFFLIARCDGKPIVFPKPTHGKGEGLLPYRTAAECINWSIPCRSIFERKKPLAENTLRRIAKGLDKFTIKADKPFIITCNHGGDGFRGSDIDMSLNSVTAKCSDGIVIPYVSKYFGGIIGSNIADPLGTVTAIDHNAVVAPRIAPYIMANNTNNIGACSDSPLPTVTTGNRNFLTAASLIQYHSEQSGSEIRGQSLDRPVMTVDMSNRYALTAAHIVKYYKGDNYSNISDPLHTITVKERNALVESHLCVLRNNMDCKPLTEPLPTECTSGGHFAEIRTRIVKYEHGASLGYWDKVRELLNKYCGYDMADDEILLLEINGEQYFIADIGMRMLDPRELYLAQGFPADYIIDHDYKGGSYPRTQQVARCGNAVPPPFAEALVRANLPEMCGKKFGSMEELRESQTRWKAV